MVNLRLSNLFQTALENSSHTVLNVDVAVNVDVANPDYKKDSQKSQTKAPAKKPEHKKTTPQPKQDTYKKPLPNNKPTTGKNNQSDKDSRIIDVSFKNRARKNFTTIPKFGETISARTFKSSSQQHDNRLDN